MELKSRLVLECLDCLEKRRMEIVRELEEIAVAISNETKSSSGDKHETSRALMQNQREQTGQRLKEFETMITNLQQLDWTKKTATVQQGSLVTTDQGVFMISIGFGALEKDNTTYYFLSLQSPLVQAMKGKVEGDTFSFNNKDYTILAIG